MRKIKDIANQRFGRLVAIRPTEERRSNHVIWECLCDCGNTAYTDSNCLLAGKTKSCGCLKKEGKDATAKTRGALGKRDITGQRFGRLVATRPTEARQSGHVIWECLCDCGNTTYVNRSSLLSGNTKSCGCWNKEVVAATTKARGALRVRDLTGQRFGKLTVVRKTETRQTSHVVWECLCDCGNTTYVNGSNLACGKVASCGCLKRKSDVKKTDKEEKNEIFVHAEDICVCCGAPVPEGCMVCWDCEHGGAPVTGRRLNRE